MPLNLIPKTDIALVSAGLFLISKIYRIWKEYHEAKAYVKAYEAFKAQQAEQRKWIKKEQAEQRSWIKKACIMTVIISLLVSSAIRFFPLKWPFEKTKTEIFPLNKNYRKPACADDKELSEVKLYIKK